MHGPPIVPSKTPMKSRLDPALGAFEIKDDTEILDYIIPEESK